MKKINNYTQNKFRNSFSSDQHEKKFRILQESRNMNTTNKLSTEKWSSSSTNNLKIEDSVNSIKMEGLNKFNLPRKKNSLKLKQHMLMEEAHAASPNVLPRQLQVKTATVRNSTPGSGSDPGSKLNKSGTYYSEKLLPNNQDKVHHQHSNSLNLPNLYSSGNGNDNGRIKYSTGDTSNSNLEKFLEKKQNENKNSQIYNNHYKNDNQDNYNSSPLSNLKPSIAYKRASKVFTSNLESSKELKFQITKKLLNSQDEETSKKIITPELERKAYPREVSPINLIFGSENKIKNKNNQQLTKNDIENSTLTTTKTNMSSNIISSHNYKSNPVGKTLKISKIKNTEEKKLKNNVRFIRTSTGTKDQKLKIKKMNYPYPYNSENNSTNPTASSFSYENKKNNSDSNNTTYNFMKKKREDSKFIFSESSNFSGANNCNNYTKKKVSYIKNFAYKSQAGKNEHGYTKINQDSHVVINKVLNLEEFNIFGVLDGHGSNGHLVSNGINKFFNNFFQNIKNYSTNSGQVNNTVTNGLNYNYNSTKPCTNTINSTREDHSMNSVNENNKQITTDVSQQIKEDLIYEKLKENNFEVIKSAYKNAENELNYVKFDSNFSGTTCVLVMIIMNKIICANAGDSRAIIVNNSVPEISLSKLKNQKIYEFLNYYIENF
jgi:serine/threonine protein phosphatase PrpC